MKKIIKRFKFLLQDINIKKIDEHAAACSYYTILSFVPLAVLILTLTKYLKIEENFLIAVLDGLIPSEILNEGVLNIIKEVNSKSIGTVTISAIVTLWSAGRGFFALCKGLSSVYQVEYKNGFIQFRLRGIIATVIFILTIVLTLILLVFGKRINLFLQEKFNIFSKIVNLILESKIFISIFFLSIILTFVYRYIPKHQYKLKNQIPGAILAAIFCNIVSVFYSIYIDVFYGFSLMYGSLTTIVLSMIWIYACMYSILLGAVCNVTILKNN